MRQSVDMASEVMAYVLRFRHVSNIRLLLQQPARL
jgi:hypothetical protein